MQHKKRLTSASVFSITCILLLFLAACGGGTSTSPQNNSAAAPPDKQILRFPVLGGDFYTLDPSVAPGGLGDPFDLIYPGLVGVKSDGTIEDQLAASHTISEDGLTYTFTLRPNLTFSDGTPLTAKDVAYSINRTLLPATHFNFSSYLSPLKDFDKVTSGAIPTLIGDSLIVKDDHTISLILSKRAAYFLSAFSFCISVVEQKLIDKYGNKWTDHLDEGGGAGLFKVKSYDHTKGLTLVPNPHYFGAQPKIQQIQYLIGGNRESDYKAFLAGQYDRATVPLSQNESASQKPGYHVEPFSALSYICMNYLAKPLDNIKIRQALSLAINKDQIISQSVSRNVIPSNHIVPKGMPSYNQDLTGPAGVSGTTGNAQMAQQLFQEGLREEGYSNISQLPSISIAYPINDKSSVDTILATINEWKQVLGISVKPLGLEGYKIIEQEDNNIGKKGPFQMWYDGWGADYLDAQDWLTLFFGKGSDHNTFNYGQNHSADAAQQQAVQAELAQADGEQDTAKRMQLYQDAEQKIVNDVGWITMYQSAQVFSLNPKVQNWVTNPLGIVSIDDWAKVYIAQ